MSWMKTALLRAFGRNAHCRQAFDEDVTRALALPPRGGISRDSLHLQCVATHMHLAWTARPVHPWDRHLPPDDRDEAFADQCLHDVDMAIARLFTRFEMLASLEIAVFHPESDANILGGRVSRVDFDAARRLSVAMRLKMAGIAYAFGRGGLQPLDAAFRQNRAANRESYVSVARGAPSEGSRIS